MRGGCQGLCRCCCGVDVSKCEFDDDVLWLVGVQMKTTGVERSGD